MKNALLAEYRKLVSTRVWWGLTLAMVAYIAFVVVIFAGAYTFVDQPEGSEAAFADDVEIAKMVYSVTSSIGYVFALIIGSFLMTNEFRHKTITASLIVEPSRNILLLSKLIMGGILGLVLGLAGTLTTYGIGGAILGISGPGAFFTNSEVQAIFLFSVLVMGLWSVMGVAFGTLITNQVVVIVALLIFTQFLEPIARFVGFAVEALSGVAQFLPSAAADAVVGASFYASMGGAGADSGLDRWEGALVMAAYIVVFAGLGRLITLRRDVH